MKKEFQSIAMLRKKFESMKHSKLELKTYENELKASSTSNLIEFNSKNKKYENLTSDKLIKLIKQLKKENKELRKTNERQANEIKELKIEINKNKPKEENSPRPQSCLRTSTSAPKKNRVVFSRELVHVMNENNQKHSSTLKPVKHKDDPYIQKNRKLLKKEKNTESHSPEKVFEENEYYTPMSSSLQERKANGNKIKNYDFSPNTKDKQKLFTKVAKF